MVAVYTSIAGSNPIPTTTGAGNPDQTAASTTADQSAPTESPSSAGIAMSDATVGIIGTVLASLFAIWLI
jgi:hypothetical protein